MTRGQKSLTWIVGLIVAYLIAAFPLKWPPFKRPALTIPISLFTSGSDCDAKPRLPEIWPKNGDKVYYSADGNGPYIVDFDGNYPYTTGSGPINVPSGRTVGPFTAAVPSSTRTYYYTLSNGSNCKQSSQYIGVIVKP
jgi:hypothetical protein